MSILKRLFKIGQAESHALVDKLEDPIKLTEQGIRDLKENLNDSLKALAEVKALAIRSKKDATKYANQAQDYERKAMLLIQKAEQGSIAPEEADRLASEALMKKQEADEQATRTKTEVVNFDNNVSKLDTNIKKMRQQISHYENELRTLKARAKVSQATKNLNKQMAQIDSSSTVSMLERMKDKVEENEALTEAYGEIAGEAKSLDDEIDNALGSQEGSDALAALKAKMSNKGLQE